MGVVRCRIGGTVLGVDGSRRPDLRCVLMVDHSQSVPDSAVSKAAWSLSGGRGRCSGWCGEVIGGREECLVDGSSDSEESS